ncbi:MAG: carbohydrate kinase family protein [Myxococcota bacterium]
MSEAARSLWTNRLSHLAPSLVERIDVVGLGENSIDHVCLFDGPPSLKGDVALDGYADRPGGQIATAVLACARLGLRGAYLGSVGGDAAADQVLTPLREAGVDLSGVARVRGAVTRSAVILVDRTSGDRTVLSHRDARLALAPAQFRRDAIEGARVLLLDAVDPDAAQWAASIARAAGIPVVLDADRPWPGLETLLGLVDFPIVARAFAEELGQTGRVREGLRVLASHGARLAVVTLGEQGAIACGGADQLESPTYKVTVRDTTGAGDAFHAGFIFGLLQGCDAVGCLRFGSAVAAINCQAWGAQGGLPTRAELERYMGEHEPASGVGIEPIREG